MKGFFRGCVVAGAVALLLVLSCSAYVHHPHFAGSSPSSVGVIVYAPASSRIAYQTNITDPTSCKVLVAGLKKAEFAMFGAKADAELNIHYGSGETDRVGFTRGYKGRCSFFQHGIYSMPSNEFFQVLAAGGIDVSLFATNWNASR